MSDILSELYVACDPNEPANDQQYVDLRHARGGDAFTQGFQNRLRLATAASRRDDTHVRALFSGHSGCGKSSELLHLRRELNRTQAGQGTRFLPVLINGLEYFDEYDTDVEDILVATLAELSEQIRANTNIKLEQTYLAKRYDELKEYLLRDVTADEGEASVGSFKAKFRLTQQSQQAREKIRKALRPRLPTFLQELNLTFGDVRDRLRKAQPADGGTIYSDFVLIVDGLDKVRRAGGETQEEPSHRLLFLEGGRDLAALEAHAVWSVPLSLVRAAAGELAHVFGSDPYVLPMVKTEQRGIQHAKYEPGLHCLKAVLQRRIQPDPLSDAMTDEALDWMLVQSGGDVRGLMKYVQAACAYDVRAPITIEAARSAVNQTARAFGAAIRAGYWPKLATLELRSNQQIDSSDPEFRDMLRQTWVLEYLNGSPDDDVTPWYGVHPVIRRLPQFKRAVDDLQSAQNTGTAPRS